MPTIFDRILEFIRSYYQKPEGFIPLHEPSFTGNEKKYVLDAIDSTYVSSVGKYVNDFEAAICQYTGSPYAVATVNGTAALHMSLIIAGVKRGDLVITQPLSFIATCNTISYIGASLRGGQQKLSGNVWTTRNVWRLSSNRFTGR